MKPDEVTIKAPVIPPVTAPATKPKPQSKFNEVIDLIRDYEGSMDDPDLAMYLRYIDDDNSTTLDLFKRCLTTGSPEARHHAKAYVHEMISDIKEAADSSGSGFKDEADGYGDFEFEYDDHWNWVDNCQDSWFPRSSHNMLRLWNAYNVMDETGEGEKRTDTLYDITELGVTLSELDPENNRLSLTDGFWRAAAAVSLSRIDIAPTDRQECENLKDFIPWAGSHPDIAMVISTVAERQTVHKETLEEIIAEKQQTSAAVSEGVL